MNKIILTIQGGIIRSIGAVDSVKVVVIDCDNEDNEHGVTVDERENDYFITELQQR
jgi:hypothetical protein